MTDKTPDTTDHRLTSGFSKGDRVRTADGRVGTVVRISAKSINVKIEAGTHRYHDHLQPSGLAKEA